MSDDGVGDYFISDLDEDTLEDTDVPVHAPVIIPVAPAQAAAVPAAAPILAPGAPEVSTVAQPAAPAAAQAVPTPREEVRVPEDRAEQVSRTEPSPVSPGPSATREEQLARALDSLLGGSPDIQAAALVSLDGFTMASALPVDMQEDRVGAMSAAILGLGERAAAALGRGRLSQVFIEGDEGYVLLIAAGDRAVLTCLAGKDAKLGLVLYDMRTSSSEIGRVLG